MNKVSSLSEAEKIASFLKKRINELGEGRNERTHWTNAVQKSLSEYSKRWENSELLPPFYDDRPPEKCRKDSFLLDFVIWRRDIDRSGKEGAWIACESEWDLNEKSVIKDFEKLLSFRAPYKVMIYDVKANQELTENCHAQFKKTLSAFQWHIDDEIYIFLEFVKGGKIANCYTCRPGEDLNQMNTS